jgi:potassium/hydrogen antiporter
VIVGDGSHQLHQIRVAPGAPAEGSRVMDLALPSELLIVLLRRGETTILPQGGTMLEGGDELLLFGEDQVLAQVSNVFG